MTTYNLPKHGMLETIVNEVVATGLSIHASGPESEVAAYLVARAIPVVLPWAPGAQPKPRRLDRRETETVGTLMVTVEVTDKHVTLEVI